MIFTTFKTKYISQYYYNKAVSHKQYADKKQAWQSKKIAQYLFLEKYYLA